MIAPSTITTKHGYSPKLFVKIPIQFLVCLYTSTQLPILRRIEGSFDHEPRTVVLPVTKFFEQFEQPFYSVLSGLSPMATFRGQNVENKRKTASLYAKT